jgi:hypothetical protein
LGESQPGTLSARGLASSTSAPRPRRPAAGSTFLSSKHWTRWTLTKNKRSYRGRKIAPVYPGLRSGLRSGPLPPRRRWGTLTVSRPARMVRRLARVRRWPPRRVSASPGCGQMAHRPGATSGMRLPASQPHTHRTQDRHMHHHRTNRSNRKNRQPPSSPAPPCEPVTGWPGLNGVPGPARRGQISHAVIVDTHLLGPEPLGGPLFGRGNGGLHASAPTADGRTRPCTGARISRAASSRVTAAQTSMVSPDCIAACLMNSSCCAVSSSRSSSLEP